MPAGVRCDKCEQVHTIVVSQLEPVISYYGDQSSVPASHIHLLHVACCELSGEIPTRVASVVLAVSTE